MKVERTRKQNIKPTHRAMQGCYGSCLRLLAGNNQEDCIQHHSDTGPEYCTPVHKNVGNNTPDQVKKGLKFVVSRR